MRQKVVAAKKAQKHKVVDDALVVVRRLCWWHSFCEWCVAQRGLQIPSQYIYLHQMETLRRRVRNTLLVLPERPIRVRIATPPDFGRHILI